MLETVASVRPPPSTMPIISASGVYKSFDHRVILDGISLTVSAAERVGVVGANGAGKSTLGAVLAGEIEADSGVLAVRRGARIAYLAQEPRLAPAQTVREAVLSGLREWSDARARYDRATAMIESATDTARDWLAEQTAAAEELEHHGGWQRLHEAENLLGRLGVADLEARVGSLSGGRRRAVALAQVLLMQPTLAILDEPTNHLDVSTIEWLEGYLRDDYGGALVLITHDRYVLDRVAERTIELDGGAIYAYEGGFEEYLAAKAERTQHAERAEANRRNFLRQELEWLRRGPKARTGKQKARIRRADDVIARTGPTRAAAVELRLTSTRSGKSLLEIEDLALEVGAKRLFEHFSLRLIPGERIGIVGPNGCGKTSLLRAVIGELEPSAGTVSAGKNTRVAYLDQMRGDLDERATVEENVAGGRAHLVIGQRSIGVHAYLERFLFDSAAARRPLASLSGGERARVALAKMLASSANLLVLDEPTNDLDVDTLAALESMILEFQGAALIVSHDRWFLDRLATSILAFEPSPGGVAKIERHAGNYSDYREQAAAAAVARERSAAGEAAAAEARRPHRTRHADVAGRPRKLTYAETIELDGLLERIAHAEAKVAELEARIADPALYAGGGDAVKETMRLLEEARNEADALTARWEELEARA